MALFKGSPSKSGDLMWKGVCVKALRSSTGSTPAVGIWLPVLVASPGMAQLSAQTLMLGKELRETLLGISVPWLGSQI